MKKIFLISYLMISCHTFSQTNDTLLRKYDQQFIYRYGRSFMKGGNKLSFTDLQTEFSASSLSYDIFTRAKKDKTISFVLRLVSTAMFYGVMSGVQKNNPTTAYIFLGAQVVTGLSSSAFYSKSVNETDRAIQIRNREVLFPGSH